MLKFYHNYFSPYSRCVWIAIQVKKIDAELIIHSASHQTNPFDYIPTINDDGFEISDTLAILDYLEAKYPTPALLPKEPKTLAIARMVANVSIDRLLPVVTPLFSELVGWQNYDCQSLESNERQILEILTHLESLLGGNCFNSDRITLAEVVTSTVIPLLPTLGISLDNFPLLKARSLRMTKWSAWLETQPQWQRERQFLAQASATIKTTALQKSQPVVNLPAVKQRFSVNFQYEVHFTKNIFSPDNSLLAWTIAGAKDRLPKKAIAVVDSGLLVYYPQLITQIKDYADKWADWFHLEIEPIVVVAGEAAKNNPQLLNQIHLAIDRAKICRHSYILAIGGGAVLDMVGYAAATAHRGIRLIRIPTTVLAQNDSAVGVKNSVNAFGKKNFLGTFAPPHAVLNDVQFLTTLEDRDWRSGVAEAIKVALIKDADFFAFIAAEVKAIASRNLDIMSQVVYRCARLHLDHIATSGDPFEAGSSRPLDFGHWAAHRLEYLTDYRLRHGEAVAIGIALDCTYSYLLNLLPYSQWQQILTTLSGLGFSLYVPELAWREELHSLFLGITEFREHLGGELTLMLLQQIGRGIEVHEVDISLYEQAIAKLRDFSQIKAMAIAD